MQCVKKTIYVLYQFNEKYAPYAGTSIISLYENNKSLSDIIIYLMVENVSDENIDKFIKLAEYYGRTIKIIETKLLVEQMKELKLPKYRGSYAANMRLFFSEFIDDGVDRLLYIDSDTIIEGSLAGLLDFDMKDNYLAMSLDSTVRNYKMRIGHNLNEDYFNSGVILFNVPLWREDRCTEKIINHVTTVRNKYVSPDQDLLNVVFKNRIYRLPIMYNFQPMHMVYAYQVFLKIYKIHNYYGEDEVAAAYRAPIIVHFFRFLGEFPWDKNSRHPASKLFDKYLKISPWNDYEKKRAEVGPMMKCEQLLYRILPKTIMLYLFSVAHEKYLLSADDKILKEFEQHIK